MNTPEVPGSATCEEFIPWQPAEDWTVLEGHHVEIYAQGKLIDQGRVESVMDNGSMLWLRQEGVHLRRLILNDPQIYIRPFAVE
jgi:hypothetical protein